MVLLLSNRSRLRNLPAMILLRFWICILSSHSIVSKIGQPFVVHNNLPNQISKFCTSDFYHNHHDSYDDR